MQSITLTGQHLDVLRRGRFFTQWHYDYRAYLDGKEAGRLRIGDTITFRKQISIEPYSGIYAGPYHPQPGVAGSSGLCSIGAFSYSYSALPEGMIVGRYCSISNTLNFLESHHPTDTVMSSVIGFDAWTMITRAANDELSGTPYTPPPFRKDRGLPYPIIEHDVWIGQHVALSLGIRVGVGAVIAYGSVVTKDVPPYAIVGGAPAKLIRYRFDEMTRARLLMSRWWDFSFTDFKHLSLSNISRFLEGITALREQDTVKPFRPKPIVLPDDWL